MVHAIPAGRAFTFTPFLLSSGPSPSTLSPSPSRIWMASTPVQILERRFSIEVAFAFFCVALDFPGASGKHGA